MSEQNVSASAMANVLIIDDENQIRKFLDIAFRAQGYKTLLAENGQKGLELLALQGADLVVLDLGLPDLDGFDVLYELRSWSNAPVIVLSVRADEEEKVKLLDAGANDYVTKPFSVQELMARIRVLLRQAQHVVVDSAVYDDGVLKTYTEKNPQSILEFYKRDGKSLHPTQKPVALLEYLIKTYTQEGETVLDFTFGSCSTGVACLNTNRKFLGIEMEEKYFDIGVKRMQESTIKGEK